MVGLEMVFRSHHTVFLFVMVLFQVGLSLFSGKYTAYIKISAAAE